MKPNQVVYRIIFILISVLFSFTNVVAQKETKYRLYESWVKFNKIGSTYYGYLIEAKDSSILIDEGIFKNMPSNYADRKMEIQYQDIEKLKLRRKGAKSKGATIGAISGVALAAINLIGLYSGDKEFVDAFLPYVIAEETLIIAIGVGIGVGVGSIKKKITLYHEPERYQENKNLLIEYAQQSKTSQ